MLIQPEKWIMKSSEATLSSPRSEVKPKMKLFSFEQQLVRPYRTIKRREPNPCKQHDTSAPILHGIREKMITRALVRDNHILIQAVNILGHSLVFSVVNTTTT